jgi:cytoskeletal protein RodZ
MERDDSILGIASIRQSRGISLQQIANATKISLRSLQAIEYGEFKKLPGGIYNTSYIRQYAKAIDFDETELLAYYYSKMGRANPEEPLHPSDKNLLNGFRPASTVAGS